jgi:transcriptional regulator with XRE-family HTH domain
VPSRESLVGRGNVRGLYLVREFGREIRDARLAAGLSQASVGRAAGLSKAAISRYELGNAPHPDLVQAARVARVVGLDLRVNCYPAAGHLRDQAHVVLIRRFLARLPQRVGRRLEAPIAAGDQRAWDVLLTVSDVRIGVSAETRIRDLQALLRREHQKQLDGGVDQLLLLVANTKHNRAALAEAGELLHAAFPLGTRAMLTRLSRGEVPADNGVVII